MLTALIIIIGAGSYLLYEFKFKTYDVADDAVTEIMAEPYKVELPDGSTILIDEKGEVVQEMGTYEKKSGTGSTNSETLAGKTAGVTSSSTGTTTNPTEKTSTTTKPTVASIKEKYRPALVGLEAQADAKINALIGRAMSEYQGKKANGEGIDFGYFYNKYMSVANNLEASTDTVFQAVLQAVEKDLVANGFDKSYAQSFKEEYEATKKAQRDSLLSKAMENR